jgi:homoserine dehydrogenase
MAALRPVPVALIGLGGVGTSILTQLLSPPLSQNFQLVLIANSRLSLSLPLPANSTPLTPTNFLPILNAHGAPLNLPSIISVLSSHPDAPGIIIDSTGTDVLPSMYSQILNLGINIVTPNKKAFSGDMSLYESIRDASWPNGNGGGGLIYGESTVGAGLPILSTLKDLVGTGDEIVKIEGVFSGTLSYIFNEFSKAEGGDIKFSEVVKVAKDAGYTVRY